MFLVENQSAFSCFLGSFFQAKGYLIMGREEAASATEKANILERAYFDG